MAGIERATGVPASTLYQWAARGGWRLGDMEERDNAPEFPGEDPGRGCELAGRPRLCAHPGLAGDSGFPDPQGPQGRPPARSEARACERVSEDRPSGREGGQEQLTPDALRSAGQAFMARALTLAAEGRARAAREALLLGQRFVRAAEVLAGAGTGAKAAAEEVAPAPDDDPRAELERRIRGLVYHAFDQDERAEAETGLEDVRGLDLTPFALSGGGWRKATDAEKARIAAGDWAPGISAVQYLVMRYIHPERWGGKRGDVPDWFTGVHKPIDLEKFEACMAAVKGWTEAEAEEKTEAAS